MGIDLLLEPAFEVTGVTAVLGTSALASCFSPRGSCFTERLDYLKRGCSEYLLIIKCITYRCQHAIGLEKQRELSAWKLAMYCCGQGPAA